MELIENLKPALEAAHPELDTVRAAAGQTPVYLVGGAVRDLLLGRDRADVDLVVVGDAAGLATSLGVEPVEHERFATAKVELDGHEIDIATARTETYPSPGALPDVAPSNKIEADLGRRDFTINAMAVPLQGEPALIDPFGGQADLAAGLLRILHTDSFVDDPTRAIRAARYASRFGFDLEEETEKLVRQTGLGTVSVDRQKAELLRLAAEPEAIAGLALVAGWGLVELAPEGLDLAARATELISQPPWDFVEDRSRAILSMAVRPVGRESALVNARPATPSEGVELARRFDSSELVSARVRGAEWLDRYLEEWRDVRLEIGGEDLIAAGVRQGPSVGRGLAAALRAKLDGEISGRDEELSAALAAAGEAE